MVALVLSIDLSDVAIEVFDVDFKVVRGSRLSHGDGVH